MDRTQAARFVVGAYVLGVACWLFAADAARAGERQFLVILANSPKQYPSSGGQPTGGLPRVEDIYNQYFDGQEGDENDESIFSFAEYWEEVSYHDVQISGTSTFWLNLQWAIQPPLVGGGTVDTPLDDVGSRNSPHNFFDLNGSGTYRYGAGEFFSNSTATTAIDINGDPLGVNDGPFTPGLGSLHATAVWDQAQSKYVSRDPVWKPGERFIDMDEDGKWDGLDEANNEMDWNGDGRPDLRGPWIDLNLDGEAANETRCIYLGDSDNDGNPDCCPEGPGRINQLGQLVPNDSCLKWACSSTNWEGPFGPIEDCNGNLIPDPCDVSPRNQASPACLETGWRLTTDPNCDLCGGSFDNSPYEGDDQICEAADGDGIPDECQFQEVYQGSEGCTTGSDDPNANRCVTDGWPMCTNRAVGTLPRCEFDDSNLDGGLDIVEPFENFLRRWDPCVVDPEASWQNQLSGRAHWVKVYDPESPNAAVSLTCGDREGAFKYGEDSYIRNNYPARAKLCSRFRTPCDTNSSCKECSISGTPCQLASQCPSPSGQICVQVQMCRTGIEELIAQAKIAQYPDSGVSVPSNGRLVYGEHDPEDKVPLGQGCRCRDGTDCIAVRVGNTWITDACVAGKHAQFDPPDYWENTTAANAPGRRNAYTTKMQPAPGGRPGQMFYLYLSSPKPDWYEQAWLDRYSPVDCPNPSFNPSNSPGPTNLETVDCTPPSWTEPISAERIPHVVPFTDIDAGTYTPETNRRYFKANFGGTSVGSTGRRVGRGTGWIDCSTEVDPIVNFETGAAPQGFEPFCNHQILPEERDGEDEPPIFYDGWVEHDDLPSSKYHRAGDQRLGEVTSPTASEIWGEDRGPGYPSPGGPDGIIPAAGPYAGGTDLTEIHGNNGRDAGNLLTMELLTWRTKPPFNSGYAWEWDLHFPPYLIRRTHPYAGPSGANLGFRDYNLDGLIDQGEVRYAGSENYMSDSNGFTTANNGVETEYPWNRDRLVEDCIEILDYSLDFDDFVDPITMAQMSCVGRGAVSAPLPAQFRDPQNPERLSPSVSAKGVLSGIILLPPRAHSGGLNFAPGFIPIHNEDNDDPATMFPRTTGPHLSWNLFFHNLVSGVDLRGEPGAPVSSDYMVRFAAHEYMHTWQGFPDLYDYDIFFTGGTLNCPIGHWDIMANGGLVHPAPILKESACTQWITPVDLTTILTPGVVKTLTLPPAEFVRDNSHFFLENPGLPGERHYFWSAGSGFDQFMPGEGMLIMHTDVGANPDALPLQQTFPPFSYEIIQADGLNELLDCSDPGLVKGDAGDPWPGSTGATRFNFSTDPPARWTTQNSWTGLDIVDIVPDGAGSVQLKLSWEPTNISSLKFINPPGGVTVPVSPTNVKYTARFRASDMYGGTTIGVYYTKDETKCSRTVKTCVTRADCPAGEVCTHSFAIGGTNLIGQRKKTTPGTNTMSMDWNIFGKPDGRYVLFAELVPGTNAGGTERAYSDPRAGRNNKGNGSLALNQVNIAGHAARSETWTVTCIDASQGKWQVNSNITQPALDSGTQQQDPYPRATTGTQYTSVGGEVKFTIAAGSTPFVVGDMFTFITTGITAPSASVNIIGGKISEDPVAIITATPLAGDPPLLVYFDGRKSRDPNGEPLTYLWNYGDGTAAESGAEPQHTFTAARTYTVVLKVTNPRNGRFGEAAVDIAVTNNSPKAVLSATPASGGADGKGLQVQLSGAQSSDRETSADKLIYHWDFGDGATANDALVPGKTFQTVPHLYKNDAQGRLCTHQLPCDFTATLKVIDEGGKSDSATAKIRVGNTNPVPNITYSSLQGPHPWAVTFNAINSYDAEKDTLKVDWDWNGDGTADEKDVPLTGTTTAKDGSVPHTYNLPAGQTTASFQTKAIVRDNVGGEATWAGVTVVVSAAATGVSDPRAIMSPTCDDLKPTVGKPFTVDGSLSFDRPAGSKIVSYTWDWGDGSPVSSGVKATHTYKQPGTYTIILTVADGDTPPKTNRTSCTVAVTGEGTGEEPLPVNRPPVALFTVDPENGFVGTEFTFDAGASADPDGDEDTLRYSWSFGDGQTATGVVVTHAYEQPKPEGYVVRLTVRDQRNASTEALREVIVVEVGGNLPPIAYIASGPRTGTAPLTLTFDGRNSYDLNGDPLEFRWDFTLNDGENDMLVGPVVTRVFDIAGEYTVSLEVLDGRGGVGNAGPETITVAAPTEAPPEPPTPRPEPDEGVVDDSSVNRPRPVGMCGLGMLPALIGSLSGLAVLAGSRRRFGL